MLRTVRALGATVLRTGEGLLPDDRLSLRLLRKVLRTAAGLIAPSVEQVPPAYERAAPPAPATPVTVPAAADPPDLVQAAALASALDAGEPPLLVDVRESHETAHGIIPGARIIPMQAVLGRIGELREAGRPVVVYCAHGIRSQSVVTHLRDRGVPARSLAGGLDAWLDAGGTLAPPG